MGGVEEAALGGIHGWDGLRQGLWGGLEQLEGIGHYKVI